jgi:PUB domain.
VGLIIKYLSEDPQLISKFRQSILSKLVSSLSSEKQDLINCISILQQIVYNLLVNPIPKYRTLKSNNPKFHQAVGRLPLGQEYLKLIGFKLLSEE